MTAAEKTRWCVERGIPRWYALGMWDEVRQIVALVGWQYQHATEAQRRDALRHELRLLRVQIWERKPCRQPKTPPSLRPSKLRAVTGYRTDSARHVAARNKVAPERRTAIAAMGGKRKAS